MRPRVEGTGEGEGRTEGCRDRVRGEKALPFLRADFLDNLSPRETGEDRGRSQVENGVWAGVALQPEPTGASGG